MLLQPATQIAVRRRPFRTISDLPAEMLAEITTYTTPLDLIRLSQSSSAVASGLESSYIWTRAANTAELPPCPEDLSGKDYLVIACSPECQHCPSRAKAQVDWDLRRRLCPACMLQRIVQYEDATPFVASGLVLKIRDVVHTRPPSSRYGAAYLHGDLTDFKTTLSRVPAGERAAFLMERRKAMSAARLHAKECRAWEAVVTRICANLRSLGWGAEIQLLGRTLEEHPLINQGFELTDEDWTGIKEALIFYLSNVRAEEAVRQIKEKQKQAKEKAHWEKVFSRQEKHEARKAAKQTYKAKHRRY
ncbi:hypothetical protein B0H16DRAFT_1737716 [Mycena metata]|uniref:F-box domain-containing protein n=1 Tax=Mycena metata TaxID=1033252 RepID=A0AAD7ML22_9AGAR|nr:hypothetical protein B0H16DRAFT_1737716 [Mycena metata]